MTENKLQLSPRDRIMLWNQYTILMALYPDDAESYEQRRTIIEQGYEFHYDELLYGVTEPTVTEEMSRLVMDVLDMHSSLIDSYNALPEKSGIDKGRLVFPGFDGNNETEYMAYARFLVRDQERWTEVIADRPHFDMNSHTPTLEMYGRMLGTWRSCKRLGEHLRKEDISAVLDARVHPSRRPT